MDNVIVDVYADDVKGQPAWPALVEAGLPWAGAMLKGTEGTYFTGGSWFAENWPAVRAAAGARYGVDFFRFVYHYLRTNEDGAAQARFLYETVLAAGGFGPGDGPIVVDIERSENTGATLADAAKVTTDFITAIRQLAGRPVALYAGSFAIELGMRGLYGADVLWIPRYSSELAAEYTQLGVSLEQTLGWQYREAGGGDVAPAGYPVVSPIGDVDTSALIIAGGGANALQWLRDHAVAG
jgi:GH25 family lysozyme M1 (1,4-beta-N-acetylmuramidase)